MATAYDESSTVENDVENKKRLSKGLVPQPATEQVELDPIAAMEIDDDHGHHHHGHHHHHDHEEMSLGRKIVILGIVIFPLLGLLAAIVATWQYGFMGWLYLGMLVGGWYLTGLGITIGYHRQLTHRSFETYKPIRHFWASLGALAVEGSPIDWCMVHRKHHQFSDHEGDPHSPHLAGDGIVNKVKGLFHSHLGWLFISNWSKEERTKYIPDLIQEDYLMTIDRHYVWWVVASFAIPMVFAGVITMSIQGALLGLLWGGLARVCFTHHMTWSINSICHVFGSRDFKSSDDSRNNMFFGIFSHGEGWHNNHHAFPSSARHGLKWWQFDLSWIIIRSMELVGVAWDVRLPSEKAMAKKAVITEI